MKLRSIACIAFLALVAASIVWSQDEKPGQRQLHALGGPFIIYRTNIQEELRLSDEQKNKLNDKLPGYLQETTKVLEKGLASGEMRSIRQKSYEEIWPLLKQTLKAEQLRRFQQLELQHEGPSALLGRPEIGQELGITDEQRKAFMGVVQDMQQQMVLLNQQAHSGGNREEIRLKGTKVYADEEVKIESILNDAQKKKWQEIYGKPFDVFNDNISAPASATKPATTSDAVERWPAREGNPAYEALVPAGDTVSQGGLYDPSIEYSMDGKVGWLVYSAVLRGAKYAKQVPIGPYCETHLAKTTDGGKTWTFVKAINHSEDDKLQNFDGQKLPGVWRNEVASIVYDPGDAGAEWKVFTHHYFWNPQNDRMPAYGWIALQTASDPAGQWSEPKPLFGSDRFPPKPYALTSVNVNALDASMKSTLVYTEPGAFYRDGTLYLSLTSLVKTGPEKIVLLSSSDHGKSWKFVNTLVTNEDAGRFGYRRFDGSAIAGQAGRAFFMVSPDNGSAEHVGTMIIEFADLAVGELKRDASGKLVVLKHLREQPGFPSRGGAGQSCFNENNTYGGVIMPQMIMKDAPQVFQMFSTRQMLIDDRR